ncbi:MAG: hypothetical protein WCC47_09115, partial [Pseudonocardiaceae bacterium]
MTENLLVDAGELSRLLSGDDVPRVIEVRQADRHHWVAASGPNMTRGAVGASDAPAAPMRPTPRRGGPR